MRTTTSDYARVTSAQFQHIDDRELSNQTRLRAFLKALKYGRRRDLSEHIQMVLSEAPMLCKRDLLVLDKGPAAINDTVVGETLDLLSPDRKERNMGWLVSYFQTHYDKAMEVGTARGMAEGKAEGKVEGEARVLARFLEKRFGIVPDAIREQIYAADISAIEAWFERAFDAPNLQSVFESN